MVPCKGHPRLARYFENVSVGSTSGDISLAVQLAAYFSKARDGSNVPVDCVQRRYVKKPAGSKPGFVIFTNQNTYYTTPDMELIQKYLK